MAALGAAVSSVAMGCQRLTESAQNEATPAVWNSSVRYRPDVNDTLLTIYSGTILPAALNASEQRLAPTLGKSSAGEVRNRGWG